MNEAYQHTLIEKNTQAFWKEHDCFNVKEDLTREKFYVLCMFPYPSGYLHMGHVRNYTIGDVVARYQRMLGKNVLHPMGWDAFGLPAENAAIKHQVAPAEWTYKNIGHMRAQFQSLGLGYDWSREIATCQPNYYRWEQWFFLRLFEKGLVYKKNAEVNWDPVDQTILANEQVVDGRGWRSGALVERKEIPQWFLKITAYADILLRDLDKLNEWPDQVKVMQRNWIGKSEGIEITFPIENNESLTIFTTRPDTLYGVTYIAIAPQHPLAKQSAENNPAVKKFLEECRNIKVSEAELATMEKRGVKTDFIAFHPITEEKIPVYVANFVVMDYASGALMAVPAHDERDHEFALKYHLPIKPVIIPIENKSWDFKNKAYTGAGLLIDSGNFSNIESTTAITMISDFLEKSNIAKRKISFRLRDWSISRQRYWGTPIPIINCPNCGAIGDHNLPVVLPETVQFSGVVSPLKNMSEFINTTCPECGGQALRETDTFDTFFESSWYYARFACYDLDNAMLDKRVDYWVPVDQYIGGIEHAVMHLLYARFMHKLLRDEGLVNSDEPFRRLLTQGMVLNNGIKMSKSKGNTVDPQPLIEKFGADTVRLFSMFASPPEQSLEWSDSGVEGSYRFLKRLWGFAYDLKEVISNINQQQNREMHFEDANSKQKDILKQMYEILDQAKYDYDRLQFNTVVSGCMKLFNLMTKIPEIESVDLEINNNMIHQGMSLLLRLLAPIAPHITHVLWEELGFQGLILNAPWPKSLANTLKITEIELVVQINGKLKTKITVPSEADKNTIESIATQNAKVEQAIQNKEIKKIIIVPKKLVNIVTD